MSVSQQRHAGARARARVCACVRHALGQEECCLRRAFRLALGWACAAVRDGGGGVDVPLVGAGDYARTVHDRKIRENHGARAPVVIGFTGDVLDEASALFTDGGAVAVMCKPYHMATIIRTCWRARKLWAVLLAGVEERRAQLAVVCCCETKCGWGGGWVGGWVKV